MPLPDHDFDTTEVAVPWRVLHDAGHEVAFATERGGSAPACDPKLLTGVLFGHLGADPQPVEFYRELEQAPEFREPTAWADLDPTSFDGLVLAGGHAPGMRQYLDSRLLQEQVAAFWALERPVGAICHGVLVLARTRDPAQFDAGPRTVRRGTADDDRPGFVMEDGRYLSARWPGDAYLFARRFVALLERSRAYIRKTP
jgi:putative intracellular protease/amidase